MDLNCKEAGEGLILCTKDAKDGKKSPEDWKEVTAVFACLNLGNRSVMICCYSKLNVLV